MSPPSCVARSRPASVSGTSVRPVCWPDRDHSVSAWRISHTSCVGWSSIAQPPSAAASATISSRSRASSDDGISGSGPARTRASMSAFCSPVTTMRIRLASLSLPSVSVIRSGGGLGESGTQTAMPVASSCGWPGKSEAVCPSGPMPCSARSITVSPSSSAYAAAAPSQPRSTLSGCQVAPGASSVPPPSRCVDSGSSSGTTRSSPYQRCTPVQSWILGPSRRYAWPTFEPPESAMCASPCTACAAMIVVAITSATRSAASSGVATRVTTGSSLIASAPAGSRQARRSGDDAQSLGQLPSAGVEQRLLAGELLVGADDVHDGVDQREVGERLREVAEVAARVRVDLLGEEPERRRVREQALAHRPRPRALADLGQRAHEPERADDARALLTDEAVVGLRHPVAQDEPVLGELLVDRVDGRDDALVVRRQEADERDHQAGGVERIGLVVLAEHAAFVDGVRADVGVDLVGHALPAGRLGRVLAQAREPRAAIARDPAHELRGGEVARLAAHLPDAAVRLAPVADRVLDLLDEDLPRRLGEAVARLRVQPDRVEQRAPHVVLALVVGAVADPDGARVLVAGEVVERVLLELGLPVDAVHDLQLVLALGGHDVADEVEEVVGLLVEAERVEAPEHERGVAYPREAVVPVAQAARRLG